MFRSEISQQKRALEVEREDIQRHLRALGKVITHYKGAEEQKAARHLAEYSKARLAAMKQEQKDLKLALRREEEEVVRQAIIEREERMSSREVVHVGYVDPKRLPRVVAGFEIRIWSEERKKELLRFPNLGALKAKALTMGITGDAVDRYFNVTGRGTISHDKKASFLVYLERLMKEDAIPEETVS